MRQTIKPTLLIAIDLIPFLRERARSVDKSDGSLDYIFETIELKKDLKSIFEIEQQSTSLKDTSEKIHLASHYNIELTLLLPHHLKLRAKQSGEIFFKFSRVETEPTISYALKTMRDFLVKEAIDISEDTPVHTSWYYSKPSLSALSAFHEISEENILIASLNSSTVESTHFNVENLHLKIHRPHESKITFAKAAIGALTGEQRTLASKKADKISSTGIKAQAQTFLIEINAIFSFNKEGEPCIKKEISNLIEIIAKESKVNQFFLYTEKPTPHSEAIKKELREILITAGEKSKVTIYLESEVIIDARNWCKAYLSDRAGEIERRRFTNIRIIYIASDDLLYKEFHQYIPSDHVRSMQEYFFNALNISHVISADTAAQLLDSMSTPLSTLKVTTELTTETQPTVANTKPVYDSGIDMPLLMNKKGVKIKEENNQIRLFDKTKSPNSSHIIEEVSASSASLAVA
jgi:hypothetical protein